MIKSIFFKIKIISELKEEFGKLDSKFRASLEKEKSDHLGNIKSSDNPFKVMKGLLFNLENVLAELGIWSFAKMFKLILAKLNEIFKSNGFIETNKESVQGLLDLFKDIEDSMIRKQLSAEDENDISKIYLHSSEKFKALVHILLQNKEKKFFHSIVFTQTRLTAYYISIMLNEMAKLDEFSFIKVGHIYGDSKCAERFKEDSMNATKQVLINCF
jgi:hypothetical protein